MNAVTALMYRKNSIKCLGVYYKQCIFYRRGWGLLEATLFCNALAIIYRI